MQRREFLAAAGLAAFGLALPASTSAAPNKRYWPRWSETDSESLARIDHAPWDLFISRYFKVVRENTTLVDYGAVSDDDRDNLRRYIERLSDAPISQYNPEQQKAFWINLFNALIVDVILQHYPVSSIRDIDISPGILQVGPWGRKLTVVEDVPLSLDDIEHRILRPRWRDPRIHYVLNSGARGALALPLRAMTADTLESQLEEAARRFVNHPESLSFGFRGLRVSSIYAWYERDFGFGEKGVLDHLRRYANPRLAERLANINSIASDSYDWRLNDTAAYRRLPEG